MEIKHETKIKETYEWFFGSGPGAPREVWIDALMDVMIYWKENPKLGTPTYVSLRTDRDFDGPTKLRMEVEWSPLKWEVDVPIMVPVRTEISSESDE